MPCRESREHRFDRSTLRGRPVVHNAQHVHQVHPFPKTPSSPAVRAPHPEGDACKLPQEIGRGCRHHATRAERESAEAEAKVRAERARERAERERKRIRAGLALVTLALVSVPLASSDPCLGTMRRPDL